jgi:hypothetical protein
MNLNFKKYNLIYKKDNLIIIIIVKPLKDILYNKIKDYIYFKDISSKWNIVKKLFL